MDIHLSPSATRIWQAFGFLLMEGGSQVHFFLIHGMLTPFMLISTEELPHSERWIHMRIVYPFWHKPLRHFAKSKSHEKGIKSTTMICFPCRYLKLQLLFPERLLYPAMMQRRIICVLVILASCPRAGIRIFCLPEKKKKIKNQKNRAFLSSDKK